MTAAECRTLFRELVGEQATGLSPEPIPDTAIDLYLQDAFEYLNSILRFHWEDLTLAIDAGSSSYTMDADYLEVQWVRWNNQPLEIRTIADWELEGTNVHEERPGGPREVAFFGEKVLVRPTPALMNDTDSLSIRAITNPNLSDIAATLGKLRVIGHRPACIWAAYLYASAYPESDVSAARANGLRTVFEERMRALLPYFEKAAA